jgi:multidrug efflux system membrane fusion protein
MMRVYPMFLLLTAVATACGQQESQTAVATAVETARVRATSSASGLRYAATVEPEAQISVAFRVGGYVDEVSVEEGDRVAKGTILARIRQDDYRQKLGQAAAAQSEAEAGLAQAKLDVERARSLFTDNALTKPDLDGAVARFDMMRARLDSGRAAAGEADLALGDTALRAPISGVILRRSIERGDLGQPGVVAFVLADTQTVKVKFGVPDTMVGSIRIADPIVVTTESMPKRRFEGRVSRIAPAADPKSRAFDVELRILNPANELKPGMVASLESARGATPVIAIPLASVIRPGKAPQQYAVYVVEQDKVRAQLVDLGEPMGNLVAVRGGLLGGEQIVVSGPALLTEGQLVRVIGGSNAQER